jgi:UDPglucose 6-dehydrogenase
LAINTEWNEFRNPDFDEVRRLMRIAVIFDGRNLYDPQVMRRHGFAYYSIGRATVRP